MAVFYTTVPKKLIPLTGEYINTLFQFLPMRREVWNCSSIAGSTLAKRCLFLYLASAFCERFLFKIASSASV